jgi:hypothetical protein
MSTCSIQDVYMHYPVLLYALSNMSVCLSNMSICTFQHVFINRTACLHCICLCALYNMSICAIQHIHYPTCLYALSNMSICSIPHSHRSTLSIVISMWCLNCTAVDMYLIAVQQVWASLRLRNSCYSSPWCSTLSSFVAWPRPEFSLVYMVYNSA